MKWRRYLVSGGALLGVSALLSKCLGLLRDRLFLDIFGDGAQTDIIFAAFRIPDFFFFLLIGGTVSTLLVPRMVGLKEEEQREYFSSFVWLVGLGFGSLCLLGILFAPLLAKVFGAGFATVLQNDLASLARFLFGSVFLLALSSVFAAYMQYRERFFSLALAPILYTGMICVGLWWWRDRWGLWTVGIAALSGAALHLLTNVGAVCLQHGRIHWAWQKPLRAWKKFWSDFVRRVLSSAAFQINQTLDIVIASFLLPGAVAAFAIGSNLGHVLLSIVGFAASNAAFPRLSKAQGDTAAQTKIIVRTAAWVLFFTLPFAVVGAWWPEVWLSLLFGLEGEALAMTSVVFFWTVLSLPAACLIPTLARVFLANNDTHTPLVLSTISLVIATGLAAYLALVYLPVDQAILGLALGNFVANFLSVGLFGGMLWWRYFRRPKA